MCGTVLLKAERCICTDCAMEMPLTYFWDRQPNPMADRLYDCLQRVGGVSAGGQCGMRPYAAALFFYRGGYRDITRFVKYGGMISTGRYMGEALGRKLASSEFFSDVDLVVPVPLHWLRRLRRGYNQAEIIAGSVASVLSVPVGDGILRRIRRTGTQTRLPVAEKAANVFGAFKVADAAKLREYRHILLVDDVFTTGSTLAECCRALGAALPSPAGDSIRISACTLACVGE